MNLGKTVFQTNLAAKNWLLGDQIISNIIDQYTERLKNYENVSNCPIEKPFFDGYKCINCE